MRDIFDEPSRIIRSVIGKASGGTSRALVVTQIEGMSLIKLPRAWYPAPDCPPSLRWAYPAGWADPSTSPTTGGSTSIRATSTGFEWYDDQGGSGSISASLYTGSDRDIASAARTAILTHQTETSLTAFRTSQDEIESLRERLTVLEADAESSHAKCTERHDRLDARIGRIWTGRSDAGGNKLIPVSPSDNLTLSGSPDRPRGCSSMARVPVFQTGYAGSIPVTPSGGNPVCPNHTGLPPSLCPFGGASPAGVAKLADAPDLGSGARKGVRVRFPSPAPTNPTQII
jgi:hypothetical protein